MKGNGDGRDGELDFEGRAVQGPLPTWDWSFAITLAALRALVARGAGSLNLARRLTSLGAVPTPMKCRITKIRMPRREDVLLEGMSHADVSGSITAEWVSYPQPSENVKPDSASESKRKKKVILYCHGGAYFVCSRKTHRGITWRLAKYSSSPVLVIDYRLAPEHPFPAALHDVLSAYLFLLESYSPDQIGFVGDSAGGGLCLAALLWIRDHGGINVDGVTQPVPMPGSAVLFSPWMDLTHSQPSWFLNAPYDYLPAVPQHNAACHYYVRSNDLLTNPLVSPLFAEPANDKQLCPILIQVGDAERLRDEAIVFWKKFSDAGADISLELYEDQPHVFQMFTFSLPIARLALRRTATYLQHNGWKEDGHRSVRVRNRKPHPVVALSNPFHVVQRGQLLMKRHTPESSEATVVEEAMEVEVVHTKEITPAVVEETVEIEIAHTKEITTAVVEETVEIKVVHTKEITTAVVEEAVEMVVVHTKEITTGQVR
ncbi:Alpha/Beta hydrolase protein [Gaertneriomyces semiglobifer]|nr:Alpha/Beta hydrolase protein [Gaertneriomyces semiglobifer]